MESVEIETVKEIYRDEWVLRNCSFYSHFTHVFLFEKSFCIYKDLCV